MGRNFQFAVREDRHPQAGTDDAKRAAAENYLVALLDKRILIVYHFA